jgi:hypothetical protein
MKCEPIFFIIKKVHSKTTQHKNTNNQEKTFRIFFIQYIYMC